MNARNIDVAALPDYDISSKGPLFLGQVLLCAIEGSMFFILIAMYFYLRLSVDVWPPPGVRMPSNLIPTLALIPLLLSAIGSYSSSEAAKRNDRAGMLRGLGLNVALALIFLAMRAWAWGSMNFIWSTDAHGSIVWAILFLHTLDTVADLLFTIVLIVIVALNRCAEKQRIGVHVDSVVWYFLVGIWVPLYAVVYWGPRVLGAH